MPISEKNAWIKKRKQLLEYQMNVFEKELKKETTRLEKLIANQEKRKVSYGLKYDTEEEVKEAYIAGLIDKDEFNKQIRAIYLVHSDRGHKMRIVWLKGELSQYRQQYEYLMEHIEQLREDSKERERERWKRYYRRVLSKKQKKERRDRRRQKKKERIERAEQLFKAEREERKKK